ncbi:MAG: CHAT domain-containing protein, partial [Maribacter sp.]
MRTNRILTIVFFIAFIKISVAQNPSSKLVGTTLIDSLIANQSYQKARQELDSQISYYFKGNLDSLPKYIKLVGSYSLANNKWETAIEKAESLISKIESTGNKKVIKNAYLELANLYDDKGDPETAYSKAQRALEIAKTIENKNDADLEGVYYNLGTKAFNKGDISLSKKHQLKNLALRNKSKDKNHEMYYFTYNTMGRLMWYSGQPDSAMYYFKAAIKSVKLLDSKPWNQYYRPALVNGNIAILLQAKGQVKNAIGVTEKAIEQLNMFNRLSDNEGDKLNAKKQKLASIDNLGVYFNSIGEYEKAEQLISYAFNEKKKTLDANDINLTISMLILGQAQLSTRKFEEAEKNLLTAWERLKARPESNIYYQAFTLTSLGGLYEELENIEKASDYYAHGEVMFRKTMKGDYTKDFLDELSDMALFYAKYGNSSKALELADEAYKFTQSTSFEGNLQNYLQLLTKAQVHYHIKDFGNAFETSKKGLDFFSADSKMLSKIDSIQIYFRKPKNVLIWAKSKYELTDKKTHGFYKELFDALEKSIDILNQRKSILTGHEDLNSLIRENDELFNFLKQLYNEAYLLTGDIDYLNKLLSINESSIYARIRTRLNQKEVAFSSLPSSILESEKKKKAQLVSTLKNENNSNIKDFFSARKDWDGFLDSLRTVEPEYYTMRYATVREALGNMKEQIPKETTIVRYIHIESQRFAYVSDGNFSELVRLKDKDLSDEINLVADYTKEESKINETLQTLYDLLWRPFSEKVKTKNVIIFPDAELFNISFELLTQRPISSFEELSTESLLNKHNISYNYSLLLLKKESKLLDFKKDFVAFVPEFDGKMKIKYEMTISDSIYLDKTYLNMLPQPFSLKLVKKFGKRFDGNFFLNEKASKQIFNKNAGEHKIIHIGTHAESNNVSPELSRLVFAKNVSDSTTINDNYLYTYEIYNQNLSSNLAILTACETGKPTYQPGEGMISLAHAFNYAGSESILTSLWQIDEQSSTQILEYFY